jgi:hypothetical protein
MTSEFVGKNLTLYCRRKLWQYRAGQGRAGQVTGYQKKFRAGQGNLKQKFCRAGQGQVAKIFTGQVTGCNISVPCTGFPIVLKSGRG